MDLYNLPDELRRQVEEEIDPNESIRWLGQPVPRGFPWVTLGPVLFAIPWTLFSLFWMVAAAGLLPGFAGAGPQPAAGQLFALFGLPFVFIGVGMLSSPWWVRRSLQRRAQRTAYLITDRRALIFDGGFVGGDSRHLEGMLLFSRFPFFRGRGEVRIRSFGPGDLTEIERVQRQDGSGDILLERSRGGTLLSVAALAVIPPAGFFSIPNVRDVERQLRELRGSADASTA